MFNQAAKVIARFGNARRLAKMIDTDPCNVYRWTYSREKGGTNGMIPTRAMALILSAARVNGVVITMEDLNPERILSPEQQAQLDAELASADQSMGEQA